MAPAPAQLDKPTGTGQMTAEWAGVRQHPGRCPTFERQSQPKECRNLNTDFYNATNGVVDPVFYPVVPDSFMNRHSEASVGVRPEPEAFVFAEAEAPLLAPRDPWSF
jgi:hypothetical protein